MRFITSPHLPSLAIVHAAQAIEFLLYGFCCLAVLPSTFLSSNAKHISCLSPNISLADAFDLLSNASFNRITCMAASNVKANSFFIEAPLPN